MLQFFFLDQELCVQQKLVSLVCVRVTFGTNDKKTLDYQSILWLLGTKVDDISFIIV